MDNWQAVAMKNFLDVNYIEVKGTAKMEVVPDRIYLKIVLNERDNKRKVSIEKSEEDMIEALKTIDGINVSEDLSLKDLSSSLQSRIIVDNQIFYKKEYELLVKNGKTASEVIKKLEKVGISEISLAKVDHSQIEQFQKTVRENAMKEAKERASSLAESIGQSIGKAIHITENRDEMRFCLSAYSNSGDNSMKYMRNSINDFDDIIEDMEFSKIKINSSIEAKFELK